MSERRRITIVGLGLIGGSLGLALRAANQGWEVVGHNRSHEAAGRARKIGAIDRADWNLPNALEGAEIVVVAVAPLAVEKILTEIAPHLAPGTIVTDVTSTKTIVLEWAERILPPTVHFVGGHPMAGKETAGIEAADVNLFRGATWCILPGVGCAPEAVTRVEAIVRTVGATPYYLDPAEHDSYVAAVSHVPFVAAAALVNAAAGWPGLGEDMQRLAAGGFRDATRTASGDVSMHRDICLTNREAIARWLDGYIDELARARDLVLRAGESEAEHAALEDFFVRARVERDRWMETRGTSQPEILVPMPEGRPGLSDMLFGRRRRD